MRFRILVIVASVALAGYFLYPTLVWSRMTPEEAAANPDRAATIRERAINLGLDLQGGIHMVLGIKTDALKHNILLTCNKRAAKIFRDKSIAVMGHRILTEKDAILIEVNPEAVKNRKEDIEEAIKTIGYLVPPEFSTDPQRPGVALVKARLDKEAFAREIKAASNRALEIIRNRIDAFGVAEPSIHLIEEDKIVVELPGAADPGRARRLIGRTAQLRFHRVREDAELKKTLDAIDAAVDGELKKLLGSRPVGRDRTLFYIKAEDKEAFNKILKTPAAQDKIPEGSTLAFGIEEVRDGEKIIPLYLLEADPAMSGEDLEMARVFYDERNRPLVTFEFGDEGAEEFGRLTAELMHGNKPLAIVLDGVVQSAPSVKSRITRRGQIEGQFTHEEARDLAVVLRSGALPAPVEILEDRTVGPSLGRDSIRKGMIAAAIGFLVVVLMMLARYRGSGVIANFGLLLNLVFVMACLAMFHATLTLPGIAGIVLTIGMAVDANILIFERIREELADGKGPFSAVNAGFERAFGTIFDANLTTLITAMVLYEFGTGPIRGFAVTLSIGILCSMYTAVYVSRTIFEKLVLGSQEPRLSI